MPENVIVLSVPALQFEHARRMPALARLTADGDRASLAPSFPAVSPAVMANMLTGKTPREHGIVGSGFHERGSGIVEFGPTIPAFCEQPYIWDILHDFDKELASAAWTTGAGKSWGVDYFPSPSQTQSLRAMVESAAELAKRRRPNFWLIHLSHLDLVAQRAGPWSQPMEEAIAELDEAIGQLADLLPAEYGQEHLLWLVVSGHVVAEVDHVLHPNRMLRRKGLLSVVADSEGERVDIANSAAWALVDHQFSHVYVRDRGTIAQVIEQFDGAEGVSEILKGKGREKYAMDHSRSGDVILISPPNSWQTYAWWEDEQPPKRHCLVGGNTWKSEFDDPIFATPEARQIRGSHGAPALRESQWGVLMSSERGVFVERPTPDTDVADIVLRQFGV